MPAKVEEKVKKEKKEKKDGDKKEKVKKDGEKKEKSSKDPEKKRDGDNRSSTKESKKDKDVSRKSSKKEEKSVPVPRQPPARQPPQLKKANDDYMGDMDLPSSESEEEQQEVSARAEEKKETIIMARANAKEQKKLADKERKLMEKAHREKEAALRDDNDVFDVAYENQTENAADSAVSARDIKVHSLTIRAKGKLLLENTHLSITAGRRYGLVGPNGKGKSTLLRLLARRQIPVPENLDVLLVEQEVVGSDESALQAVVAADVELLELKEEEAEILAKQEKSEEAESNGHTNGDANPDDDDDSDRLNEIYERMQEIGANSAEARASKILHGLGFTEVMQKRRTQDFSGGWRMRISLARALFIQPTVLLLDEPTNHLDLRAVLWLEEYLQRWKKTLVVVSHDRDFLNMVTTDIIHLHDLGLHAYRGNFAQFEEMYDQRRRQQNKVAEKFEKDLKIAKKSGSKAAADKVQDKAKHAQKKKNKNKQDENPDNDTTQAAPRKWADYTVHFEFPEPSELSTHALIQLNDVSFKYPGRDDFGLQGLNIGIDMGSRVAIVGPNGAGKTTLMNLLAGDIDPTSGDQRKSHLLRVGRYAQHFVDALNMEETPVEYLMNKYPEAGVKPEQMRAYLGRFGLSGHHHLQPICKLSGGQKSRVVFTSICLGEPHILLLDEPTNHLDMQSIDALSDALAQFEGGVVVISHDSQLLSVVCDDAERSEVWLVEDGKVETYDGYFQDYKDELMKEISDEMDEEEVYQRPDAIPSQ